MLGGEIAESVAAPVFAGSLSAGYVYLWLLFRGLKSGQVREVIGQHLPSFLGLAGLDAARAVGLTAPVLVAVYVRGGKIANSTVGALVFWLCVGLAAFFVDVKLPSGVWSRAKNDDEKTQATRRVQVPSAEEPSGAASAENALLYAPNSGFVARARSKLARSLQTAVAESLSRAAALAAAHTAGEVVTVLAEELGPDDIVRWTVETRIYLDNMEGLIPRATIVALHEFLEVVRLDLASPEPKDQDYYRGSLRMYIARLQFFDLQELAAQLLETTKLARSHTD